MAPDEAGGLEDHAGSGTAGEMPPEARPCMAEHRAGRACAAKVATAKKVMTSKKDKPPAEGLKL